MSSVHDQYRSKSYTSIPAASKPESPTRSPRRANWKSHGRDIKSRRQNSAKRLSTSGANWKTAKRRAAHEARMQVFIKRIISRASRSISA
jgi:hypothetical protein